MGGAGYRAHKYWKACWAQFYAGVVGVGVVCVWGGYSLTSHCASQSEGTLGLQLQGPPHTVFLIDTRLSVDAHHHCMPLVYLHSFARAACLARSVATVARVPGLQEVSLGGGGFMERSHNSGGWGACDPLLFVLKRLSKMEFLFGFQNTQLKGSLCDGGWQ